MIISLSDINKILNYMDLYIEVTYYLSQFFFRYSVSRYFIFIVEYIHFLNIQFLDVLYL